ncbi:MAG: acetylxylan esterase [Clostridiales bacterium]|nr:acetylxylan esterase [Clostridiales bacterium]
MLQQEITKRELPPLLTMNNGKPCTADLWRERRTELLDILQKYIYGYTPEPPKKVTGEVIEEGAFNTFAGKVHQQLIKITFDTPNGEMSFPLHLFLPKNNPRAPLFLHIAFRPDIPDRYTPVEEITDNGFGLALFCYKDVVNDNLHGDYSDGLGKLYFGDRKREPEEWGKIGMWAYAASRALDYLLTRDEIDHDHIAVVGHSRLGKTALWTAAQDERFFMGISNNSGIGGAAISKHSTGERISAFLKAGSWDWYCERFKEYDGLESINMPYDQHYLLASIAPRCICVGSAEEDKGADPKSEFLSCVSASEVYKLLGHSGLVTPDKYPLPNTSLHEGQIGYHIRTGHHFFSRCDWIQYMKFMNKKISDPALD